MDKPSMLKERCTRKSIPKSVHRCIRVVVSMERQWYVDTRVVFLAFVPEQTVHQ